MSSDRVAQLEELHAAYCPLLDELLSATPDTVGALVAKEKQLGEQIWTVAGIAYGPRALARLKYLKPKPHECADIAKWLLAAAWLNEEHRVAVITCCVRAHRLSDMFANPPPKPKGKTGPKPPNLDKQIEEARLIRRLPDAPSKLAVARDVVRCLGRGDSASDEAAVDYIRKKI